MTTTFPFLQGLGPVGFGGGSVGNLFQAISDEAAEAAVAAALSAGITYVDTAPHYGFGLSERRIGRVLAHADAEARAIVSTKVGRALKPVTGVDLTQPRQAFISPEPFESVFDYSYDAVMRSWEGSCRRLGRERIDILLAHDLGRMAHGDDHPAQFQTFMDGGYRAMRALRDAGLVRAIGIGVNEVAVCLEALDAADFDVLLLAGRYTLLEQTPLETLFPLWAERGVTVIAGGPYNSGILAVGARGGGHYDYGGVPPEILARVSAIEGVCARYDVPLAAAALRFPLAHPQIATVIPGMDSAAQVLRTATLAAMPIPTQLWAELKAGGLLRSDAPVPAEAGLA
jgi:D-threo-aldose 1-dehydrogenase